MVFDKRIIALCGGCLVLFHGCDTPPDCSDETNFGRGCSDNMCGSISGLHEQPEAICYSRCPDVYPSLDECIGCLTPIGTVYGTGCAANTCQTYASTKPSGSGVYSCSGMFCGQTAWVRNCTLIPPVVSCSTTTAEYSSCEQTTPASGIFNCVRTAPPQPSSTKQTCTVVTCSNGTTTVKNCYNS